jgi:hypothetical protein
MTSPVTIAGRLADEAPAAGGDVFEAIRMRPPVVGVAENATLAAEQPHFRTVEETPRP